MKNIAILIIVLYSNIYSQNKLDGIFPPSTGNHFLRLIEYGKNFIRSMDDQDFTAYTWVAAYVTAFMDAQILSGLTIEGFTVAMEKRSIDCSVETGKHIRNMFPVFPENLEASQLIDIVHNYLKNNPQSRHEHISTLVWFALEEAFNNK